MKKEKKAKNSHRGEKLEKEVQAEVIRQLAKMKWLYFWRSNNVPVYAKNNAGKMSFRSLPKYTPRGLPDIMVFNRGTFVLIEIKRVGMKLRPEQAQFASICADHNFPYYVVHSVEELLEIKELRKKKAS